MKKSLPFLMLLLLFSIAAWAQTRTITGTVTAESDQNPLPGVSIRVVGQKTGTLTNSAGKYSIQVTGTNLSLEFSYLGFKTQTKTIGNSNEVNVSLSDDQTSLNEIVVTALGIKRDKRTLTYSTQEVGGNALVAAKENNIVNALAGKVAGVQITNSSGAAGSSSKIVIRGNTSLTGENGALFVVDGVPINNSEAGNPDGALSAGGTANRAIDIDPNIIESVTILKGAAASALYGSAAARGVVIITTKTGKGRPSVSVSSGITVDHPIFPEFQDKYAQGSDGVYIDGNNGELGSGSWGPLIDGLTVNGVPVEKHDPRKEFFRTGFTTDNTVAVSGASDKSTYLVSYSYLKTKGTMPGTDFGRHSFFTKFSNNITDKINVIGQLNYVNTSNDRLPEGNSFASPFWTVYSAPISWNPLPTRYYLRLSKAAGYTASAQADLALAALQNGFSDNADNAKVAYKGGDKSQNPWYRGTLPGAGGVVLNKTFVDLLTANNDPRLPILGLAGSGGGFLGRESGTDPNPNPKIYATVGPKVGGYLILDQVGPSAPVYLATYAEALFIKAEATLIKSGAAIAQPIFVEAIRQNMLSLGVATNDINTYVTAHGTLDPATPLKSLIGEKYVSNFLSLEAYNDWRRTGFPTLNVVANAFRPYIPQRFPYPSQEITSNPQPQQSISTSEPVWWAK